MKRDPRATVIEIYLPGGFSPDYQAPAEVMGLQHYGIWNDRLATPRFVLTDIDAILLSYFRATGPDKPRGVQPKGFHGSRIPVDGPTVAALVEERILEPLKFSSMPTHMQEEVIEKWQEP